MSALPKPVLYGVLGGLAWFVLGILVGHHVWKWYADSQRPRPSGAPRYFTQVWWRYRRFDPTWPLPSLPEVGR